MFSKILFNIFVMFIGALASITCYILIVLGLYDERISILFSATVVTVIIFIITLGSIYVLIVLMLKSLDKYSLLNQTLSFLLIVIALFVIAIPLLFGVDPFLTLKSIATVEGVLISISIIFCNFICSYGIWIAEVGRSKRPFYIISILVLISAVMVI